MGHRGVSDLRHDALRCVVDERVRRLVAFAVRRADDWQTAPCRPWSERVCRRGGPLAASSGFTVVALRFRQDAQTAPAVHGVHPAARPELAEDFADVVADPCVGDAQGLCDFPVALELESQQDLPLALGERRAGRSGTARWSRPRSSRAAVASGGSSFLLM